MRQLQPVIWSKGTILTPQHLQTRDLFLESTIQFRLEALNFRPWGIQELGIDQEALAAGNFAITRAVGILPDGLPFDIPDSDPAPAQKPLEQYLQGEELSTEVFLAIPEHKERGLNVSLKGRNADTRYISAVVDLRDEIQAARRSPFRSQQRTFVYCSAPSPERVVRRSVLPG